jgi:hypothetical protein
VKDTFEFDIKRVLRLIRNEYHVNLLPFLTALGAVFIVMLASNVLFRANIVSANGTSGWFSVLMLFMGYIFTSLSFKEIHQSQSGIFYLTLPASNFEKFIAKFLVYSIGYIVVLAAAFFLFSGVVSLLDKLLFKEFAVLFNPFQKQVLIDIANFLAIQAFFLFCAVTFKKLVFLKAIMILVGVALVLGIAALLNSKALSALIFDQALIDAQNGMAFNNFQMNDLTQYMKPAFKNVVWPGLQIAYWAILAPLFWTLSFLKFRRAQA